MSEVLKLNSGFSGLINKPKATCTNYAVDEDIVEYVEEQYVEKTGEGDKDFVVKKRVVESSRINRQDYVGSFADEVGIKNILKKVQATGDETLLKQRPDGAFIDVTQFPDNRSGMYDAVKNGVQAFDNLPDDIKKKMSMEDFVNNFGQKEFDSYIQAKVDAIIAAKAKEGEAK